MLDPRLLAQGGLLELLGGDGRLDWDPRRTRAAVARSLALALCRWLAVERERPARRMPLGQLDAALESLLERARRAFAGSASAEASSLSWSQPLHADAPPRTMRRARAAGAMDTLALAGSPDVERLPSAQLAQQAAKSVAGARSRRQLEAAQREIASLRQQLAAAQAERERLLQPMANERSWLQAVFAQLPAGVLLVQPDGQVRANPRAERIVGRHIREVATLLPGEQLLTPCGKAVDPEDFPTRRVARGDSFEGTELILVRADRRRLHLRYSGHPVTESGRAAGGVVVMEDVTCQREHERLMREWSSVIVHDLRQPLAAIELTADMLKRHPHRLTEEQAGNNIARSAKLMGRLLSDLVDSSQLEANRLELQLADVDAGAMIEEIVSRVDGRVLDKRIRIERPLPRAQLRADAERLEQLLWNLLTNAAKYGFAGSDVLLGGELRNGQLHLRITNEGPGLDRDGLGRLFLRFERMHKKTMPEARGLGLGLYISKGIVEAHGGQIWAESVPNVATTFHVVLPLRAKA